MHSQPKLRYTDVARRELQRCRQFLRRRSPNTVTRRMRELMNGVRALRDFPKLNRVRQVDPATGLEFRRYNVGQFVIAYVYFEPDESEPRGVVSLRGIRHASMHDALWEVRECTAGDADQPRAFLSTRWSDGADELAT
jgi:plasmid stabilization system protein ParE